MSPFGGKRKESRPGSSTKRRRKWVSLPLTGHRLAGLERRAPRAVGATHGVQVWFTKRKSLQRRCKCRVRETDSRKPWTAGRRRPGTQRPQNSPSSAPEPSLLQGPRTGLRTEVGMRCKGPAYTLSLRLSKKPAVLRYTAET